MNTIAQPITVHSCSTASKIRFSKILITKMDSIPFYTNLQCEAALPWKDLTNELEKGLEKFSKGQIEQPVRATLLVPEHQGFLGKTYLFILVIRHTHFFADRFK